VVEGKSHRSGQGCLNGTSSNQAKSDAKPENDELYRQIGKGKQH
jgi:hypothetical protein